MSVAMSGWLVSLSAPLRAGLLPAASAAAARHTWQLPSQGVGARGVATSRSSNASSSDAPGSGKPSQQQQQEPQQEPPQQQQQQQEQQEPRVNVQHEAQEMSKAFMSKSLSMEELWFSAVGGKLKVWSARAHPELKGKEQEVLDSVHAAYLDTLSRAATGRLLTNRSRTQLKQACLAASTYKVLAEAVPGSEQSVEEHIADCMGGLYAPFMLGGLRFSSWLRRVLLRQTSASQAVDTLHTIARDMEGACHCSVQPLSCGSDSDAEEAPQQQPSSSSPAATDSGQQQQQQPHSREEEEEAEARAAAAAAAEPHTQHQWQAGAALTVDSCAFAEVLAQEGVPQLLRYFCCQHNMSWLEVYAKQGVAARLEACIGRGDACCRVTVSPAD